MPRPLALALPFLMALAGCRAPAAAPAGPYVLVLGTAQDGGLPQIGCEAECCERARRDPARARLVASLLVVDPRTGRRWLVDATPDLPRQLERARGHGAPEPPRAGEGRPAPFAGIFLTHAHVGHYTGLLHLGREAYATQSTPVHCSEAMASFLASNAPWEMLVREGRIELRAVAPGEEVRLAGDLSLTPIAVPHRHEYTDTFAWIVRGPRRALLYLPDIDKWERWERPIEELLREVDLALLDGSFHAGGEIPGRSMEDIPHPFLVESLARFAPLPAAERAKVRFTHLNHSNPAADPASAAAGRVRAAGSAIAREGEMLEL